MLNPQQVLETVQRHGPIIPNEVRKLLNQPDGTLVNVYLSQLLNENKIRQTNVRLGSSSFFYTPEQRPKIAELVEHLNEKDRRVAAQLKQEGVMRSGTADPLTRVALQSMKDFAMPVQVKTPDGEETFYRWFLLSAEDASKHIRATFAPETPKRTPEAETPKEPETTPKESQERKKPEQPKRPDPVQKKEQQKNLEQPIEADSEFAKRLLRYFAKKDIAVDELTEVRKDSDVEAVIRMPTPVGRIKYFVKARSKQKSNDGDLAQAILLGKKRMLPTMYLTTGTVTQKAKEQPELQEVTVVEIGRSDQ